MKVLLKGLFFSVILVSFWIHGETLWSNRLFLNEPRIHVIQPGEYLSKIAQQYYGKASYWRALALLNRAPDPDKIYPGERIMLPEAAAVAKIARARRLSEVNEIAFEQEQMAKIESEAEMTEFRNRRNVRQTAVADEPGKHEPDVQAVLQSETTPEAKLTPQDDRQPETPPAEVEPSAALAVPQHDQPQSGGSRWIWPSMIVALLVIGSGYVFVRRRRETAEPEPTAQHDEPVWEAVESSGDSADSTTKPKDKALMLQ